MSAAEVHDEFQDVEAVLRQLAPATPPPRLAGRVREALAAEARLAVDEGPSLTVAFRTFGDDAFSLLVHMIGDEVLAEEALEEALFRCHLSRDQGESWEGLDRFVREAGLETLRLIRKAGGTEGSPTGLLDHLAPETRVLLLALGVRLGRADGTKTAGDRSFAAGELAQALRPRAHAEGNQEDVTRLLALRAVGSASASELQRLDVHLSSCAACAVQAERLDEELEVPFLRVAEPERLWGRVQARIARDRAHRTAVAEVALRVSLNCTFCHSAMNRPEAVFCAGCLAPHHGDCFEEHGRCSALGCRETEFVRPQQERLTARAHGPQAGGGGAAPKQGKLLPLLWVGLGGLLGAAAFAGYSLNERHVVAGNAAAKRAVQRAGAARTAPDVWRQLSAARAAGDLQTWHRLGRLLLVGFPDSAEVKSVELPIPIRTDPPGYEVYVNGVFQGTTTRTYPLVTGTYAPADTVRVEVYPFQGKALGGQPAWSAKLDGRIYYPPGTVVARDLDDELAALRGKLEVLAKARQTSTRVVLDEFLLQLQAPGPGPVTKLKLSSADAELHAQIQKLLARIRGLAKQKEVQKIAETFTAMRRLLKRVSDSPSGRALVRRHRQRLGILGDVHAAINLQSYVSEANVYLRQMRASGAKGDLEQVEASFAKVREVATEMALEDDSSFHQQAKAVLVRARQQLKRAYELEIKRAKQAEKTAQEWPPVRRGGASVIRLKRGAKRLRGVILKEDADTVTVDHDRLGRIDVKRDRIARIWPAEGSKTKRPPGSGRRIRLRGTVVSWVHKDRTIKLRGSAWRIPTSLLQRRRVLEILSFLKRGDPVDLLLRNGKVIDLQKGVRGLGNEQPRVTRILESSEPGDRLLIQLKGEAVLRAYKLIEVRVGTLKLARQVQGGEQPRYLQPQELERRLLKRIRNAKATAREPVVQGIFQKIDQTQRRLWLTGRMFPLALDDLLSADERIGLRQVVRLLRQGDRVRVTLYKGEVVSVSRGAK